MNITPVDINQTLLKDKIVIPITDATESIAVQNALFTLGCGFYNGSQLIQEIERDWSLIGIAVNANGLMTCFIRNNDETFFDEQILPVIQPFELLSFLDIECKA